MEIAHWGLEGNRLGIIRIYFDLTVAVEVIHEREHLVPRCGVNQHVYVW